MTEERAALLDRASRLLTAGRTLEALAWYRRATDLDPDDVVHEIELCDTLLAEGHADEAEASLRRATTLRPDDVSSWSALADVLDRRGLGYEARRIRRDRGIDEPRHDPVLDYWNAADVEARVGCIAALLTSDDERILEVFEHFLRFTRADERAMQRGQDYWAVQASILVRVGMAAHEFEYANGPVPDRDWISTDVERYLERISPGRTARRSDRWWTRWVRGRSRRATPR